MNTSLLQKLHDLPEEVIKNLLVKVMKYNDDAMGGSDDANNIHTRYHHVLFAGLQRQ